MCLGCFTGHSKSFFGLLCLRTRNLLSLVDLSLVIVSDSTAEIEKNQAME
jgi:hypothetical protein